MKIALLLMAFALTVYGCGRQEPLDRAPKAEITQPPEKPSAETRPLTDASLNKIVREALQSESSLDARNIEVQNREGVVALRGTVGSEEQKEKAGRIVGSVGGVTSVDNQLDIDQAAATGASAPLPK